MKKEKDTTAPATANEPLKTHLLYLIFLTLRVYLDNKDRFYIQIFVKLIIYESSYKKSKSISKPYFYRLSKLVERVKIHISYKFKKCVVFVSSFILIFIFFVKINLSFLGMIDILITWGWKKCWRYWGEKTTPRVYMGVN